MSKCVLPKNGATIRIEQCCKRRKDRMKPKRQEDSSCVFAYYFSRHLPTPRYRRKRKPKSLRRRSGKRSFVKAVGMIRQENRQGRGKLPPLYAAVRVRCRSYGVSRICSVAQRSATLHDTCFGAGNSAKVTAVDGGAPFFCTSVNSSRSQP